MKIKKHVKFIPQLKAVGILKQHIMKKLEKANAIKKEIDKLEELRNHLYQGNLIIGTGSRREVTFFDEGGSLQEISQVIDNVRTKRIEELTKELNSLFK